MSFEELKLRLLIFTVIVEMCELMTIIVLLILVLQFVFSVVPCVLLIKMSKFFVKSPCMLIHSSAPKVAFYVFFMFVLLDIQYLRLFVLWILFFLLQLWHTVLLSVLF